MSGLSLPSEIDLRADLDDLIRAAARSSAVAGRELRERSAKKLSSTSPICPPGSARIVSRPRK